MYHGRPHDYTAFASIAKSFQRSDPIDGRIQWAVTTRPPPGDDTYFWAADDRGMADYVIGSFAMFGPRVESLYRFYFVVLAVSVLLFLIDYASSASASALLLFAIGALYVCLSLIPLGNLTVAVFEAGSLYEPRIIELLALIATLHLSLSSFTHRRWNAARFVVGGLQAGIVAACYHARSAVSWEVIAICLSGITAWWWSYRESRADGVAPACRLRGLAPLLPAMLIVAAITGAISYRHYAYNPRYFVDVGSRTIWHNVLMGLGVNATLSQKYHLGIADRASAEAVIAYRRNRQTPPPADEWDVTSIMNSLGGYGTFDWADYEREARGLYWQIWRVDTVSMMRCYLVDKPAAQLDVVVKAWRGGRTGPGDLRSLRFNPLSAIHLLLVLPGLWLAYASRAGFGGAAAVVMLLLACSAIPGFLFYPVVHAMMGTFAAITLVAYVTMAAAVAALGRHNARSMV